MVVFSSTEAAMREGFHVVDFDCEYRLYVVEKDLFRRPYKSKVVAFARGTREMGHPVM